MERLCVCLVLHMQVHVDRTSSRIYIDCDTVYPLQHAFISQVLSTATGLHFPVGSQTCPQWLRTIMDRAGIDLKYKGGPIRMATLQQLLTAECRPMLCLTQANRPVGKSSAGSTTELASERRPRALAELRQPSSSFNTHMTGMC